MPFLRPFRLGLEVVLSLSVRKAICKMAWAGLAAASLSGCGYEVATGRTMGTSYAITADCPGPIPATDVARLLAGIDARMSTYKVDSELMRFNRAPEGVWVAVSTELVNVVAAGKQIAEETGGAFDPTVAPLVALWGFGASASGNDAPPTDAEIRAARLSVGHVHLRYRASPPALAKHRALTVDLSGIAKGHAVDRVADRLDAAGCGSYLVELGGEIRARGRSPSGGPWRLGVDSPEGQGRHGSPITLADGGVATSGDYRQYREREGRRESHIIDPRSGYPIDHRLASVTVVARSARAADAYATALMVLGERDGVRFADGAGLAATFIVRSADGFDSVSTRAMADVGARVVHSRQE